MGSVSSRKVESGGAARRARGTCLVADSWHVALGILGKATRKSTSLFMEVHSSGPRRNCTPGRSRVVGWLGNERTEGEEEAEPAGGEGVVSAETGVQRGEAQRAHKIMDALWWRWVRSV